MWYLNDIHAYHNTQPWYWLTYHLLLITRNKHNRITDELQNRLCQTIESVLKTYHCSLLAMNVGHDHMHIIFEADPDKTLSSIVNAIKTQTEKIAMQYSHNQDSAPFWSENFFLCTAGNIGEDIIKEHLEHPNVCVKSLHDGQDALPHNEINELHHTISALMQENALYASDLNQTRDELEEIMEIVYKDALTGVRSYTAYTKFIQKLDNHASEYAVVMIDINHLKHINDTYGHDIGNHYIIGCARLICHIFKMSPVFRIGGDEFVVILEREAYENKEALIQQLKNRVNEYALDDSLPEYERLHVAVGMGVLDVQDTGYADVFARADKQMYIDKQKAKKQHTK